MEGISGRDDLGTGANNRGKDLEAGDGCIQQKQSGCLFELLTTELVDPVLLGRRDICLSEFLLLPTENIWRD